MLNENEVFGAALCGDGGFRVEMVVSCVVMAVDIVSTLLALASRNGLVMVIS